MVDDTPPLDQRLLLKIKEKLPELKALLVDMKDEWGMEDGVYRFYHQSFKVFGLQNATERMLGAFRELSADINPMYLEIVAEGTGKHFEWKHNEMWLKVTRPIVEAFFHSLFFLEMICKYGEELEQAPSLLPSGWAAVLYLFNQR